MHFHSPRRNQRLALLTAALLLFANTLVTAHAFGEESHAVADNCQLLHQFERQQQSPVDTGVCSAESASHFAPQGAAPVLVAAITARHFQPRAPPFA